MKIIYNKDIFTIASNEQGVNAICVTTNGIVKTNGEAVMGAGIAKTVNERFHVAKQLGTHLKTTGNRCYDLGSYCWEDSQFNIISFPTKENWRNQSIPELIVVSAHQLVEIVNKKGIKNCYLTPPGCGCGGLNWNEVKPLLETILDDRFTIIFR